MNYTLSRACLKFFIIKHKAVTCFYQSTLFFISNKMKLPTQKYNFLTLLPLLMKICSDVGSKSRLTVSTERAGEHLGKGTFFQLF